MVVVMVVVVPVAIMFGGAIWSALFGWVSSDDADRSYLRSRPDVTGPVGVIGFCFGGGLAYGAGCELDPACVVAYYGVGVELLAERIDEVTCPALLHFGTDDVFITPDALERLQAAAGATPA